MSHAHIETLLNDYLDEALTPERVQYVEAHLQVCTECRSELEALRALLSSASALPASIEPSRDLWPDIDSRVDHTPWRQRSVWSLRYGLVAAAIALIVLSSGMTVLLIRRDAGSRPSYESASLLAEWSAAEAGYVRAANQLSTALETRRGKLDPETIELIDRNLGVIDEAIRESKEALAADPANRELVEMLASIYKKKIDTLQQLSALGARL